MSPEPDGNRPSPAGAGILLLTTMVLFGAAGGGLGSLVGATGLLLTLGIFAGLVVGIWVVYTRYRDL